MTKVDLATYGGQCILIFIVAMILIFIIYGRD